MTALLLAYLGTVLLISCANRPLTKLAGFDVLAQPGAKVTLRAKLENDGPAFLNPDIEGAEIEFLRIGPLERLPFLAENAGGKERPAERLLPPGELLGAGRTDDDGMARLEFQAPEQAGDHFFRIRLKDPEGYQLRESEVYLIVSVAAADRPLIITDIDNTICKTSLGETIRDEPAKVPPLEDAARVLTEASRTHRVVYLTARPIHLIHRTRNWLATHDFPTGPVFFRDLSEMARKGILRERDYKSEFLRREVKAVWKDIRWGIGNIPGDADAYQHNGIPSIIITRPGAPLKREAWWTAVHEVQDWKAIENLIKG